MTMVVKLYWKNHHVLDLTPLSEEFYATLNFRVESAGVKNLNDTNVCPSVIHQIQIKVKCKMVQAKCAN